MMERGLVSSSASSFSTLGHKCRTVQLLAALTIPLLLTAQDMWTGWADEGTPLHSPNVFKPISNDMMTGAGPLPMLHNPFGEEIFPKIQCKPLLVQLETISSCPMACYLGEETNAHLSTTSFQTLHQLRCHSLDTLQHLNVFLVVRGPKLNTGFEVRPHQCRVQGHDHFPTPAGHTIFDTSKGAVGLFGHLGTLLAHIQLAVHQHPQVLFCRAAFQPLFPKPVAFHGVAVAQVQDPTLSLVEPQAIGLSPSIQPVQIPLQSLPTLKQINTPAQLSVLCKLTEGALDPLVQIIDKDIKQDWPQHRALGNTTCDQLPTGVNSIHHHSLGLAIQPVFYPAKRTPIQAMSIQFLQENAVGNDNSDYDDKVKCLWVRMRGKANKADVLLGVCYRPPNRDEEADSISSWQKSHNR
ncbi:hypothetical protein QYF61_024059 [Mycteria americana]|uniref:Uncharacterized protein n=1 Tax=Mycteria americana TaxID=33587 RepID=A0AAN7NWS6_MYCAM|nr:hypothetical protein QYF61_024059 [Mycteria americana]